MASRLPIPGSDDGTWGSILNDYLSQSLNADGTLKPAAVTTAGAGTYSKPGGGIPGSDIAAGTITDANISASAAIARTKLDSSSQTSLGKADTALQSAPVVSVAGKTGVVTLVPGDVGAPTTLAALGDVSGAGGATATQVLTYNGSAWTPATVTSTTVSDATTSAKGIVQLAGDLAGSATAPSVAKLNGISVSGTPSTGNILTATGSAAATWQAATTTPDATTTTKGIVQLAGDLAGTAAAPSVAKVNGITVTGTPSSGNVLTATGSSAANWQSASKSVTVLAPAPSGDATGATDTPALNNALAAMSSGGTFQLQVGTYYLNAPLKILQSNLAVQGTTAGTTLQLANNANCDVIVVGIRGQSQYYTVVRDLAIYGNKSNNKAGNGLHTYGSRYGKYERLWITQCKDWTIFADGTDGVGFGYDDNYENIFSNLNGGGLYDNNEEALRISHSNWSYADGIARTDTATYSSASSTVTDSSISLIDQGKWVWGTNLPGSAGNPSAQVVNVSSGSSFSLATLTNGTSSATNSLTINGNVRSCTTSTSGPFVADSGVTLSDAGTAVSGTGIPASAIVANVVVGVGWDIAIPVTPTGSGAAVTIGWSTQEQGLLIFKNGGHRIHHNIIGSGGSYPGVAVLLENSLPTTVDHNRFDQTRNQAVRCQAHGGLIMVGNDLGSCAGFKSGTVGVYNVIELAADHCIVTGNKIFNTAGNNPDTTNTTWKYAITEVGAHDYNIIVDNDVMISQGSGTPGVAMSFNGAHTIAHTNPGNPDYGIGGDVTGSLSSLTVAAIKGVTISGTPSSGQVLTATAANAAHWAAATGGGGGSFPLGVHSEFTGEWTTPSGSVFPLTTASTTQGLSALNTMDLIAVDIAASTTFTAIGLPISAAAVGSGLGIRFGIYADDGTNSRPSLAAPLLDAGTLDPTVSYPGSATITNVAVTTGVGTVTTAASHGFSAGMAISQTGLAHGALNTIVVITTVPSATTYSFITTSADIASVADSGTAQPTQDHVVTISQTLAAGRYWIAGVLQGTSLTTAPSVYIVNSAITYIPPLTLGTVGGGNNPLKWQVTGVSGALPTLTAASLGRATSKAAYVGLRI